MDTGSARSRFTIYGQRDYLGSLYHGLYHWTIHKLFTGTIFYSMDANYFLKRKPYISSSGHKLFTGTIFYSMDANYFLKRKPYISSSGHYIYWMLLRRCRYYSMELLFSTCYIYKSCQQDNFFVRCRHHLCL